MNRARKDNAPANIAILKRIAKNILQITDLPKVPISHRIRRIPHPGLGPYAIALRLRGR
jgi:hypothetical protein